jgi:beta-galactosidase
VFVQLGAVSSAFYLWINGEYVGYSEGSKTASEFDVSSFVRSGENTIAVEVYRWSTGSYLEDQDFWSLSGIQRDVSLLARPRQRVRDFFVHAGLDNGYRDGEFRLEAELHNSDSKAADVTVSVTVLDAESAVLSEEIAVSLGPGNETLEVSGLISAVNAWSAEIPNLYTLVLELSDGDGELLEAISQRIGFKTVEIVNGRFMINGEKIKLKGANLHEHHQRDGHVVDEQTMLEDIRLMKAANFNAVRNSHYPHQERWYELTSEHGLYVIDEANVESHGYGYGHEETLGDKPHWKAHYLDRNQRMVERAKNFPSIVIWSLGNEAGDGRNLGAAYDWVKSRDPSRPVHYNPEGPSERPEIKTSDFHSRMYQRYWEIEGYAQINNELPYLINEYVHSMGNSTGNLAEYWEVINRHDILAGAFIWDWVDQGLLERDEQGAPYWAYGGDYGPPGVPSSGTFCINGIVFPDRGVQPAYWEVKRVYQHVDFELLEADRGTIRLTNNYDFLALEGFDLHWQLLENGRTLLDVSIGNLGTEPGASQTISLWKQAPRKRPGAEYHLNVQVVAPQARGLLSAGHVFAETQFALGPADRSAAWRQEPAAGRGSRLKLVKTAERFELRGKGFSTAISRDTGLLSSLIVDGEELLLSPLKPNFWRAPTENDFGNYMQDWAKAWREAGDNRVLESIGVVDEERDRVEIESSWRFTDNEGRPVARWRTVYTVRSSGEIHVSNQMEKEDGMPVIPRLGMNLELVRALDRVAWFGRGPFENYSDRKVAANVGLYQNRVEDHYVAYVRPQENGYKTDVRWLALHDGKNSGLLFRADELISFGVHHNRQQDFIPEKKTAITREDGPEPEYTEKRNNPHINDIVPRDLVSLDIDLGQMGVGGDTSWGLRTLQEYSLNQKGYRYGFTIRPFNPLEEPPGRF